MRSKCNSKKLVDQNDRKHVFRQASTFRGVILMSDYATKKESLERRLFGLPQSMVWFIKLIKAGTLLFLFEHEERKLYGVFESTCDGAINIMPNAFVSLRRPLPAQILFKRIWMCKPLSEDEFCHAIKDNYYEKNKFNFGLSYDQVFKLVQLFYIKRIDIKVQRGPGIPNEIIQEFEERVKNKFYNEGRRRGTNLHANEHSTKDKSNLQSGGAWPHWSRWPMGLTSLNDLSTSRNSSECQVHGFRSCHGYPRSGGETFSRAVDPDYNLVPHEPVSYTGSSIYKQYSLLNGRLCASHLGTDCFGKNKESSHLESRGKDLPGNYSSKSMEEDNSEEYYPSVVTSRLRSDTEHIRTSVFSRLVKAPKFSHLAKSSESRCLSMSKEACHKYQKPVESISYDQLKGAFYQRRGQHTEMNDHVFVEDAIATEGSKHLILNSTCNEEETTVYSDSGLDEGILQSYKRRKHFCCEECTYDQGSTAVEYAENVNNGKSLEGLRNHQPDSDQSNISTSDKVEKSSRYLGNHKKEISNRNLLWFLQKNDGQATVSNEDDKHEETRGACPAVSEGSVQETDIDNGSKKHDGIARTDVTSSVEMWLGCVQLPSLSPDYLYIIST